MSFTHSTAERQSFASHSLEMHFCFSFVRSSSSVQRNVRC